MNKKISVNEYQLVVAEFNERAIKVYERIGFIKGPSFKSKFEEKVINFISM